MEDVNSAARGYYREFARIYCGEASCVDTPDRIVSGHNRSISRESSARSSSAETIHRAQPAVRYRTRASDELLLLSDETVALRRRMSTIASAVLLGVVVLLAGNLPWALFLAPLNLRFLTSLPWAILPMAIYLPGRLLGVHQRGHWSERHSGNTTGVAASAAVAASMWAAALVTGLIGFAAALALTAVMARLIVMPCRRS